MAAIPAKYKHMYKRQAPLNESNDGGNGNNNSSGYNGYYGDENSWWFSGPGMATRYAIVVILMAALLAFFVGGYYHARSRIKHGKAPLAYHRWMVHRNSTRTAFYPPAPSSQRRNGCGQDPNSSYPMHEYPPPPPAYSKDEVPPPTYQPPPMGATKAMPDQSVSETERAVGIGEYAGPAVSAAARQ